jgi:hypothetical protein
VFGVCYGLIPSLSRNPLTERCVFARLPEKKSRRMEYRCQIFEKLLKVCLSLNNKKA